jgi:hypothetical protein
MWKSWTVYVKQSQSWEANSLWGSWEIPCTSWNPVGSLPCAQELAACPYPNLMNLLSHPLSLTCVLILSTLLCTGHPSGLFHAVFPIKTLYTFRIFAVHSTCSASLILITWKCGEEYKSWNSSFGRYACHHLTSSPLDPNVSLSLLYLWGAQIKKCYAVKWTCDKLQKISVCFSLD